MSIIFLFYSDHSPSADDIYTLSPKRRRYSDMNVMTPSPTLFHQDYSPNFKHSMNYNFGQYSPDNAFMSHDTEKAYRKMFTFGATPYVNNRNFETMTNTTYNTGLNFPTTSWLPNMGFQGNEFDHFNNNDNNNVVTNNNNNMWEFKIEDQVLPNCRVSSLPAN